MPRKVPNLSAASLVQLSCSALWLLLIGFGFVVLLSYQTTEGEFLTPPQSWPDASTLQRSRTGNTVLLFLHPKCPCSIATLTKLEHLLSHHREARAYAIFVKPQGSDSSWERTKLTQQAKQITNLITINDNSQSEMSLFKAATSGLVLDYDSQGNLDFAGGITPGRGHDGDCEGADKLDEILANRDTRQRALAHSAVYGCPFENATKDAR